MSGILLVADRADPAGLARAEASLCDQGFRRSALLTPGTQSVQAWTPASNAVGAQLIQSRLGSACCVGPLWYRGKFGSAALFAIVDEIAAAEDRTEHGLDEHQLRGSFALFVQARGRSWLLNDPLGLVHVYRSEDARIHCTSWLATRAYVGDASIDEAAAIEYVLLGASHSNQTVARGVGRIGLGEFVDVASGERRPRPAVRSVMLGPQDVPGQASIDAAVDRHVVHYRSVFREIAAAFPGQVNAALSGGFDSRLIVAGMLDAGERPRLFVYGSADNEDVVIARCVAQAEGLELDEIDKAAAGSEHSAPDLEELVRAALFFDGLPNDGIYDDGSDRQTRLAQTAGGRIALNGGGGEILRNFFHLPDRGFRPLDIVRAFYRGFDRRVFRRAKGLDAYEQRLAGSIGASVGLDPEAVEAPRQTLTRESIELIYPLFRCHHWMGLNNSVCIRHGFFTTPLTDLQVVHLASALPLEWKNAGDFESRLVTALHAGIAAQPSIYGFRFSDGPDRRARRQEWLTGLRPASARPLIASIGRRVRKAGIPRTLLGTRRALLPGEWLLDPVLDLERLPDEPSLLRALSVELIARELAP